ncbi:hypothetical protein CR511_17115 [Pseudomonas putida]|nr:hypothetical protein CR511_17115 [Pseudomonas putida]
MRWYREARGTSAPAIWGERLRLIVESVHQAVTNYQKITFGDGGRSTHWLTVARNKARSSGFLLSACSCPWWKIT